MYNRLWQMVASVGIPVVILGSSHFLETPNLQVDQETQIKRIAFKEMDPQLEENEYTLTQTHGETVSTSVYENKQEVQVSYEKIDQALLKKISWNIQHRGKVVQELEGAEKIIMDNPKDYGQIDGITTFRGNPFRNRAAFGTAEIKEEKLRVLWSVPVGAIDRWTGVGWNGQPSIVAWPEALQQQMNLKEDKKNKKHLKEVIYGTLDGNVYFLDLEDGKTTREKLKTPGPIKGSVTVDPRGIPLLYVGQGINTVGGKRVEMGYRIFSLINQEKLFFINGSDAFAHRSWGAFDSTALIDAETDNLILGGENGLFYRIKLNTQYEETAGSLAIDPQVTKYRYKITGNPYQGIENSVAVYRNLAYFADNGGWLQCIDVNKLQPLWIRNVTDDTDSTIVIEEEEDQQISLYTACEVDKQGVKGLSYIRKLDALSGELLWEKAYSCQSKIGENPNNGGALATPLLGKQEIEHMVVYNLARYGGFNKGLLVALDKHTGEEIWKLALDHYSWSSPVDIYTEKGKAYILLCDSAGKMFLIEGLTGKVMDTIALGANVEGSPAVYGNIAVVGTRGQKIFGIQVK